MQERGRIMKNNIDIAKNIMHLRKEQGMTQEDLARYLGVTKASVSKWETGQSFPDIALLPRIATYFSVSIDALMGYAPQMTKEQIKRTYLHLRDGFGAQSYKEAHESCMKVVKEYWACPDLLVQIAILYLNHMPQAPAGDARDALLIEAQGLCRRAVELSTVSSVVRQANAVSAMCFMAQGNPDDAIDLLQGAMAPSMGESTLLAQAYMAQGKMEDARRCAQVNVYQELIGLLNDLPTLAGMYTDDPARLNRIYERTMVLIDAFNLEEVYVNSAAVYAAFASAFLQAQDESRTYECLERYVAACAKMRFPLKLGTDDFFDKVAPWLEDLDLGDDAPRDENLVKQSMVTTLEGNPIFAPIADEARFKQLVIDLKARLS